MKLKEGTRFLKHCVTVGPGEAGRRIREKREDERIRRELERNPSVSGFLSPPDRMAQEKAAAGESLCFHAVFYTSAASGALDAFPDSVRREALQSLADQTLKPADIADGLFQAGEGDWMVFLEPDGFLHPSALYLCAKCAGETGAEMIYADEDFFTDCPGDRFSPYFKPDYGPESLPGCNVAGPFLACRCSLLKRAGAEDFAAADPDRRWDLTLRLAEAAEGKIAHLPRILYYRRLPAGAPVPLPPLRRVSGPVQGQPLVSILIPNKDHIADLKRCVDSIREKTAWLRYEIVVIENNSAEEDTFRYYRELERDGRIRVVTRQGSFNYAALNNLGVRESRGEQILLLNNDTEVISPSWIQEMLLYTQRPDVGAAGAKLYYPDGTIQHAGIGIGIKMLAGHYHRGFPGDSPGYFGRLNYAQDVSAVTAACMMIPRSVYESLNGMDETFPVVFNDVDLCLRIRHSGKRIVWTPWAELTHYESLSRGPDEDTPEKKRFFVRETNRFLRRWYRELEKGDPYYNPNLTRWAEDFSVR